MCLAVQVIGRRSTRTLLGRLECGVSKCTSVQVMKTSMAAKQATVTHHIGLNQFPRP